MPRRAVELCSGEYYRLYNRGNNRQRIFLERENWLFFLQQLRKYLVPTTDIIAYCLMPTHYHLLVFLNEGDLSHQMQLLSISYTKAMNTRYERVGALFQGAFQARHIDRDEYLVGLSAYIHVNPVAARLVEHPEAWAFSSYREYIGLRGGTLAVPDSVLAQFPSRAAYREYVESYLQKDETIVDDLRLD